MREAAAEGETQAVREAAAEMGAKGLAKYLQTTKVATRRWKLGIDNKPANPTNAIGWGTLDQPQDEHHDGSSGETGDEAEEEN